MLTVFMTRQLSFFSERIRGVKQWQACNLWTVQFNYLGSTQTKTGTSIKEVKTKLVDPSTLSHDKASNTLKNQRHQFSYKG